MEGVLYNLYPAAIPTGLCLYVLIQWKSIRSALALIINRVCLIHYEIRYTIGNLWKETDLCRIYK